MIVFDNYVKTIFRKRYLETQSIRERKEVGNRVGIYEIRREERDENAT